jgi:hypothetical protein
MAVRAANILAARAVADAVRTSLGPRGSKYNPSNLAGFYTGLWNFKEQWNVGNSFRYGC